MAISKIKLGNGEPQLINDSKALHYIGHATAGITESGGVYTSSTTITIGSDPGVSTTVTKYDFVTFGTDNINLVCIDTTGSGDTACTWDKLTEKAAEIPVRDVQVNGTTIVANNIANIGIASASALGVVKIGDNITIGNGQSGTTLGAISVPDATTAVKGVVQIANAVDATSATAATDVPTVSAVATAIADLPQAMIFRGTLGDAQSSATINALPTAAKETAGDVYKVITAGTYDSQAAQVGDLFICQQKAGTPVTYAWVLIPSGDVPAGTVTSIAAEAAENSHLDVSVLDDTTESTTDISTSGTITVGVANGYEVPDTTRTGQWDSAYAKVNPYTEDTDLIDGLATAATQTSGDGSVLVARFGTGADAETLCIDYIKPTISTTAAAVCKPITNTPTP